MRMTKWLCGWVAMMTVWGISATEIAAHRVPLVTSYVSTAVGQSAGSARVATAEAFRQFDGKSIKVATYNIHWGQGLDDMYDIHRVVEDIRALHADIIGLQEVDKHWGSRSRFDDQVKLLARELQMYVFFAPIYDRSPMQPGEPQRQHGNVLLSRFPIIQKKNQQITRLSTVDKNPVPEVMPGFADAKVDLGAQQVHVYVTHLDYRQNPAVRAQQINEMVRVMEQDTGTQILIGDLNAEPKAPELHPLWNLFQDTSVACKEPCLTYPADKPTRRIDYVLVTPDIQVAAAKTMPTIASDHRPFVATITLPVPG